MFPKSSRTKLKSASNPKWAIIAIALAGAIFGIKVIFFSQAAEACTKTHVTGDLQAFLSGLSAGDVACIRAGTYVASPTVDSGKGFYISNSGSSSSNMITVKNFPGETVILKPPPGLSSGEHYPLRINNSARYVKVEGLTLEGSYVGGAPNDCSVSDTKSSVNLYVAGAANNIDIVGNEILNSTGGSGILLDEPSHHVRIIGNKIHDNVDLKNCNGDQAHGIYMEGTDQLAVNNIIYNHSEGWGIQMYDNGARNTSMFNTIAYNSLGGVVLGAGNGYADAKIVNNIIASNSSYAVSHGGGTVANCLIQNNIFFGNSSNTISPNLSCISSNNSTADPKFSNATTRDFHILSGSSAIDAASSAYTFSTDYAGDSRPQGVGNDIGAYEFACKSFVDYGTNNWPPACAVPFSASSPFNRPVPANPPLMSGSSQKIAYLTGLGPPQPSPIGTALSKDYQHPYYIATKDDILVTIDITTTTPAGGSTAPNTTCETNGWDGGNVDCRKIRIPKDAQVAGGGDGHITIVQPTGDPAVSSDVAGYSIGLYDALSKPTTGWASNSIITATSGGKSHILTGSGIDAGNTTAASFNNLAGIIRAQEMTEGSINHALFGIVRCTDGHVLPVPNNNEAETCRDGVLPGGNTVNSGGNSVPLGAKLWLDMTPAQIDALNIPAWKKTILKAIAKYGILIGDTGAYSNSNFSFGFMFESSATYTSFGATDLMSQFAANNGFVRGSNDYPYSAALGNIVDSSNNNIWSTYLRVLDPCVSMGTCPGTDTTFPTVSITQPANNANVTGNVTINATASDNVGVTKVEFYDGASLIGTDTSSPYSITWNAANAASGSHNLTAKAYDAASNIGSSSAVSVNVSSSTCPVKSGDINGDGLVNHVDLSILLTNYGQTVTSNCADFNNDKVIDIFDLSRLLSNFGK